MPKSKAKKIIEKNKSMCLLSCIVSVVMLVAGFLMPPQGVIDGSVLQAVGLLLLFNAVSLGFKMVELGYDIHFSKDGASIDITNE